MIENIVKMNTRKMQTFISPGKEAKKVFSKLRILFNLCIERKGLSIRIVRKALRLESLLRLVNPITLTKTIMKSIQFHPLFR